MPKFEYIKLFRGNKIAYTYDLCPDGMLVTAGYHKMTMADKQEFIEKLRAERDVVKIYFNGADVLKLNSK